jgi:hypothetical protein
VRSSDIVIQINGLGRSFPISDVDSLQSFVAPSGPGKTGMFAGAIATGSLLGFFSNGLCDFDCTKSTAASAAIGAGVGGVIGRVIGGAIGAAQGEWVTRYRRTN